MPREHYIDRKYSLGLVADDSRGLASISVVEISFSGVASLLLAEGLFNAEVREHARWALLP